MISVALVTGSSRGIGFEVAKQLAARGYRVIVTSRDENTAAAAGTKIGRHAVAHALDTSDESSIREIAAWITSDIGQLDVVVNNAAILLDEGGGILDTSAETFETTMRTNALGPLLVTQSLAALL